MIVPSKIFVILNLFQDNGPSSFMLKQVQHDESGGQRAL